MSEYKSYIHVERLGRTETEGILDGKCHIFPKIDGTNAVVFLDDYGVPQCGSRSRVLTAEKDNAGFYSWFNGENPEAKALRAFVKDWPHLIVYGEFGLNRVGKIKYYDPCANNRMWIFDIWSTVLERYLTYDEIWAIVTPNADLRESLVPCLAVLDNPTKEELAEIAKKERFLIYDGIDKAGEGIVIKNYEYRDKWGRYQVGKLVLDEYHQLSEYKPKQPRENVEEEIADYYVTDAEIGKAVAKVLNFLNMEKIDLKNGQFIGRTLNLTWTDFIEENMMDILKRYKNPILDFGKMRRACDLKVKKHIGLI